MMCVMTVPVPVLLWERVNKMWSYYGTKLKLAKHYPYPEHDIIIEPFCGAARYGLFGDNWKKDVLLFDKYDVIVRIWDYLINHATRSDIVKLPELYTGQSVDDFSLELPEKYLIGFCINSGSSTPKKTVAKYNSWPRAKQYIADNLYKIKHWKIKQADYKDIPNSTATWFMDPPYQYGGQWYHSSVSNKKINYRELAKFCMSRRGQVIVCENTKACWLPFEPLVELNGQLHKTVEAVYIQ